MSEIQVKRYKVPGYWIADAVVKLPKNPTELILLLHGYSESGKVIFERLEKYLPESAAIVSPNGVFPFAQRKGGDTRKIEHEMGYSWYFYDFKTDEYIIDMETAIQYCVGLIRQLDLDKLPLRIVGFSQGGYLAPFVGLSSTKTQQVIGIACRFLEDELPQVPSFRMDAVHGDRDDVIEIAGAQESHRRLIQKGVRGRFITVSNTEHRLTLEVREKVRELLGLSDDMGGFSS